MNKIPKREGWRRGRRKGSAALEFGLWFVPMMMMLSGIIDLSWYMSLKENVMRAGRDAARAGASTYDDGGNEVENAAKAAGQGVLDGLQYPCPDGITYDNPIVTLGGVDFDSVKIDVNCNFEPLLGLLPILSVSGFTALTEIKATFTMLHEHQ